MLAETLQRTYSATESDNKRVLSWETTLNPHWERGKSGSHFLFYQSHFNQLTFTLFSKYLIISNCGCLQFFQSIYQMKVTWQTKIFLKKDSPVLFSISRTDVESAQLSYSHSISLTRTGGLQQTWSPINSTQGSKNNRVYAIKYL
jgi:hypothetical protein